MAHFKESRAGLGLLALTLASSFWTTPTAQADDAIERIQLDLLRHEVDIGCQSQGKNEIRSEISRTVALRISSRIESIRARAAGLQDYLQNPASGALRSLGEQLTQAGADLQAQEAALIGQGRLSSLEHPNDRLRGARLRLQALQTQAALLEARSLTRRSLALPALRELERLAALGDRYQALQERAQGCFRRATAPRPPAPDAVPEPGGDLGAPPQPASSPELVPALSPPGNLGSPTGAAPEQEEAPHPALSPAGSPDSTAASPGSPAGAAPSPPGAAPSPPGAASASRATD